jgi:hypothetical protein
MRMLNMAAFALYLMLVQPIVDIAKIAGGVIFQLYGWLLSILFNILLLIIGPVFYIGYILIYKPVQISYRIARRYKLESYLRFLGIFPILLGVLLITIWN